MQYLWLENLVKEGQVRSDIKDYIYNDCAELIEKNASAPAETYPLGVEILSKLTGYASQALSAAALGGGTYLAVQHLDKSRTRKAILNNYSKLMSDPQVGKYQDKASARFEELAKMFPYVAAHPQLSSKLVMSRLHSGFSSEDLQRLAATNTHRPDAARVIAASFDKTSEIRPEVAALILADTLGIVKEALPNPIGGVGRKLKSKIRKFMRRATTTSVPSSPHVPSPSQTPRFRSASEFEADLNRIESNLAKSDEAARHRLDVAVQNLNIPAPSTSPSLPVQVTQSAPAAEASKDSKFMEASKNLLSTMALITGANLLVGTAVGAANMARSAINNYNLKKDLEKAYNTAMQRSDPHNEPLHANKDKARRAFETLAHFSPKSAVNPDAARWFMNNMVSQDIGTSMGSIKELSEIERNLKDVTGHSPFLAGFRASVEATGMPKVFSKGVEEATGPLLASKSSRSGAKS